jgi:uncharacterized membrane protein
MTNGFAAFGRAVGWGTVVGAAPYTVLFIIPLAIAGLDYRSLGETTLVLAYPLMLSGAMVLGSAVLLGLPLTLILSGSGHDKSRTYAAAGIVLGAFVPAAIVTFMAGELGEESLFFALPGTLAGLVTGTIWGRWREALNP